METFSSFLSKEKLNGVGMHSFPWSSVNMSPSVDHSLFIILLCVLSHFSRVRLLATLWTVAHQAPLSMGFSRQEYWRGLQFHYPIILLYLNRILKIAFYILRNFSQFHFCFKLTRNFIRCLY